MTRAQRAAQIWPILTLCAIRRQTLTYDQLGKLIRVPKQALGQLLEPIQSYCILNKIPPVTVLVVGENTGTPGEGFMAEGDVPSAQAKVFTHPWLEMDPPSVEALTDAVEKLPSNGRSLHELLAKVSDIPPVQPTTNGLESRKSRTSEISAMKSDPQEKDPVLMRKIKAAEREAVKNLRHIPRGLGFCHSLWEEQKRILKEKHGIDWRSPAEMNPDVCFD